MKSPATQPEEIYYPKKWRPSLSMIVLAMLVFVLALPIGSMWFFRLYDNILVRETEGELIVQGALISAMARRALEMEQFPSDHLPNRMQTKSKGDFRLQPPQLDLPSETILPRRTDALAARQAPNPVWSDIGKIIYPVIRDAQRTTLAGYRLIDQNGVVFAGASEVSQSLAHVPEVERALKGHYASAIRDRVSTSPRPPIYSVSRGTNIRVFVAMPIAYKGKVAGVVYLSRTPSHFLRELYGQIDQILLALFFIILVTIAIALLFVRTIKGPIDALNDRTKRIAQGDRDALKPLHRHGTREIASLSKGLLSMSHKLQDKNEYIRTFANHVSHELKSPLTSIRGAAELVKDSGAEMPDEKREKFLDNIIKDTSRLSRLLERLRDLASAENQFEKGASLIVPEIEKAAQAFSSLEILIEGEKELTVAATSETIGIIFSNLFENASKHGASTIIVDINQEGEMVAVTIRDNGSGITPANRKRIMEPFFTTRRDTGGTGMGLNIIQSTLVTHGGMIKVLDQEVGAGFEVRLPVVNAN